MPKIPDLGKLTDKIDLSSLLENVKTLINPESKIPPGGGGDPVGQHLHEMSEITHRLSETYAHQQRDLQKLASLMKAVYDALQAEHPMPEKKPEKPSAGEAAPAAKAEPEAKPAESDAPKAEEAKPKEEPPKSEE